MSADERVLALRNAHEDNRNEEFVARRHRAVLAERERLISERAHRRALSMLSGSGESVVDPTGFGEGCVL